MGGLLQTQHSMFDWRPEEFDFSNGFSASIIISNLGERREHGDPTDLYAEVRDDLRDHLEQSEVYVAHVDPYVGAGGHGLGVILQFLDIGANVIAWGTAATVVAPRIRATVKRIRDKFRNGERLPHISLSAEAVQVLVTAEICETEGVEPLAVEKVNCIVHSAGSPEPRTELEQIYCAYTVTVSCTRSDGFYHTWIYVVSPQGNVFTTSTVKVPMPNATHWFQVDLPSRKLSGLI